MRSTYTEKLLLNEDQRQGLLDCIGDKSFNLAMTMNFDFGCLHTITQENATRALRAWDAAINRKLLGRNWARKHDRHLEYFAFLEKMEEFPHYHLLVNAPAKELGFVAREAKRAWQRLKTADKSHHGVEITALYNQPDWASYISKELTDESWLYSKTFKS